MFLLLACTGDPVVDDTDGAPICDVEPEGQVSFPEDESRHPGEQVEWYYWTGHLQDAAGRWFGFEQVYFFFDFGSYQSSSAHRALTDVHAQTFDFDVAYVHELPEETDEPGFSFDVEGQLASGLAGQESLVGSVGEASWDLTLASTKAPVLQHGDGYHDYDVGGFTWYYSRERMDLGGTLTLDGEALEVSGQAWFDHQWGELTSASEAGWDWFAIQLDDDREIMLFLVTGSDELVGGSITDAGCHTTEVKEVTVTPLTTWKSPHTGCSYPTSWSVKVGELELQLDTVLDDQELHNDYKTYWEGAMTVSGDVGGRAYVELAGRCG